MDRLARSPETGLVTSLSDLRTGLDAFRNAQRTSGRSGVLGYFQQSTNLWDYTDSFGSDAVAPPAGAGPLLKAVFTDDGSQDISMTNLSFLVYANGTDITHQLTPQSPVWTDGTRSATIGYGTLLTTAHTVTQNFSIFCIRRVTLYVKAFATSSSRGTVSVTLQ